MNINKAAKELEMSIINSINQSGLPVSIAFYVCKSVFNEVEMLYNSTLNSEDEENNGEITE